MLQTRKLIIIILFVMCSGYIMAQQTADIGVQLAAATYWGDIENVNYSRSVTPVVGVLGRWNFNKRMALRGQLFTGNLKAEGTFSNANLAPSGTSGLLFPRDPNFAFNFSRSIQSVEALFEFNFRDYRLGKRKKNNFTPFVSVGVGGLYSRPSRATGTFILDPLGISVPAGTLPLYAPYYLDPASQTRTNNTDVLTLTLPVGVGFKFNITKRLGGLMELIVRKTFADNIDNLDDPSRFRIDPNSPLPVGYTYDSKSSAIQLNHNDWYATLAVSISYQLWSSGKGNCAIY